MKALLTIVSFVLALSNTSWAWDIAKQYSVVSKTDIKLLTKTESSQLYYIIEGTIKARGTRNQPGDASVQAYFKNPQEAQIKFRQLKNILNHSQIYKQPVLMVTWACSYSCNRLVGVVTQDGKKLSLSSTIFP